MARAKNNVETWFPVSGVLEDFEESLEVMETILPGMFEGASRLQRKRVREHQGG